MDHPTPEGWGSKLTEPEFVSNQTGHLGINMYTDPEEASDMWERANAHCNIHGYNSNLSKGE